MTASYLEWGILVPALLAGILVLLTHVPLGREVLSRGIIFIDLAVAQIAALGVVFASMLGWGESVWLIQLVVVACALCGALLLHWCESTFPQVQEALIGVTFVLAATLGILLLAHDPHGGEQLKALLAGQILWVDWPQLGNAAVATLLTALLWWAIPERLPRIRFYITFALAVTISVQLVGVYLVFASLIIPALLIRHLSNRQGLWWGYSVGTVGYGVGLLISFHFDLPAGPLIVWSLALLALIGMGLRCKLLKND